MQDTTITKVTRSGQITLPASARHALHVEVGDYIEVRVTDDSIILTPKKLIDKSQMYFWSESWQGGEREASDDIAAGHVHETEGVDDLIARLDRGRKRKR